MTRVAAIAVALLLFIILATANAGGYRYGVSDQAFYVPAVAGSLDPALFPRDRALFAPQMRFWAGDELLAGVSRVTGATLPTVFGAVYLLTLVTIACGAVALARALGCDWWTIAVFLALLTLRHRIAKTGANSLEGYMHPRMLAFAIGLFAFASLARGRRAAAIVPLALSALIHTTTAIWFAAAWAIALAWPLRKQTSVLATLGVVSLLLSVAAVLLWPEKLAVMDDAWLAVLGEKDYLFSAGWPAYAWVTNLAYPVIILLVARRREARGVATAHEPALVAGLLGLVLLFLASVPLSEARIALAVQLQVNRVFWVLDAVTALYVAWWLMNDAASRWAPRKRLALAALLVVASAARGFYVVRVEAGRSLVQAGLPPTAWTDAMRWIETGPRSWHVLADPEHAWKYGASVRVAARRDTILETGKDTAMAMYDRPVAMRVAERMRELQGFDELSTDDLRRIDSLYGVDVLVDRADRPRELPVLYRNAEFVVYDLR